MPLCGLFALILILRVSGPRTLAKITPLDFIVAVTIGSAFGRTLTATTVPVAQTVVVVVILHLDGSLGVIGDDALGDASSLLPYTSRSDVHRNEG